jgi:ribosome recycling factor
MLEIINRQKAEFEKVIEFFKKELQSLRVGRATPAMLENIRAESYGVPTPIVHLASINVQDPKSLVVQPWDKNNLKAIEKAIQEADLGVTATIVNNLIRVAVSSLTEETRKEVIKKLNHKAEETKVSLRAKREKVKEEIIAKEKNKEISEDEKFKCLEELDKLIKDYNEKVKEIVKKKEEEIMTI